MNIPLSQFHSRVKLSDLVQTEETTTAIQGFMKIQDRKEKSSNYEILIWKIVQIYFEILIFGAILPWTDEIV